MLKRNIYREIVLRTSILLAFLFGLNFGLQITSLDFPSVIQNNTKRSLVLDCKYRYEPYEVDGLEVKWFWNNGPEPVYQWIPGKKPEAMGVLKGRVNLAHRASKDRFSIHRAISLIRPSIDLSGLYTCRVSSFHDEEILSKKLIVFVSPKIMDLTFEKRKLRSVKFFCVASFVYPKPNLKLIFMDHNASIPVPMKLFHLTSVENLNGSFNASIEVLLQNRKLPKETLVQCLLEIPGTKYRKRKELIYFPHFRFQKFRGSSCETLASLDVLILGIYLLIFVSSFYS